MEYYLAFSLVFFLFLFFFICLCRALFPVQGVWTVLEAKGTGEELQQKIYALRWLNRLGFLQGNIYIVKQDLETEGEALLTHLLARWPELKVCEREHLGRTNSK